MTAFTEYEQWDHNYEFYLLDKDGRLGRFDHFGWRLLPPTIAKSKENLDKVAHYFKNLHSKQQRFKVCPDLLKHLNMRTVISFEDYLNCYSGISSKGLYSYDSYDFSAKERPYFRVTLPIKELLFEDLPQEIREILNDLRIPEISFFQDSLIREEFVAKL